MAILTLQGNEIHTNGSLPAVGSMAPDFKLVDKDLKDITLADLADHYTLISIVPSLDTPVCATSTKQFNELAEQNRESDFIIISADLPFAMSRFCGVEEVKNVNCLSMMRSRDFARDYGILIEDGPLAGITARAVIVLDDSNKVVYSQLVTEIADEPDYAAAGAAMPKPQSDTT